MLYGEKYIYYFLIYPKAPERISNDSYSFPGDIWSFGLTLLAVVMGRFPLQTPAHLSYWDLLRIICDDDPPEAGENFSYQLNEMITSCLGKLARDRPTVGMLLQHPYFLQNSSSISTWKKSSMSLSHSNSQGNSKSPYVNDLLLIDPEEDDFQEVGGRKQSYSSNRGERRIPSEFSEYETTIETDSSPPASRSPSHSVSTHGQSALSKLTENTKKKHLNETDGGSGIPSAVCYGNYYSNPSQSLEEDEIMTAVRLEHLERVLDKTDHRYDQMVAIYRREKMVKQQQQQGGGMNKSSYAGDRSAFQSVRSSRSFMKSPDDPMVPLPNLYSQSGKRKWNHLAYQLHLPGEIVTATAANIINRKYFARDDYS